MEEKKAKKKVDMVTVISVVVVTVIICLVNSWLYYNAKIDNIRKNNEVIIMKLKSTIEDLNTRNRDLQVALDKFNEDIKRALEGNN